MHTLMSLTMSLQWCKSLTMSLHVVQVTDNVTTVVQVTHNELFGNRTTTAYCTKTYIHKWTYLKKKKITEYH